MVSEPVMDLPPRHDVPASGRSGFVRLGDRQVHYLERGHARRPAVVCLHGGGQTAYTFEELGHAPSGRNHVLGRVSAELIVFDSFLATPEAADLIARQALA